MSINDVARKAGVSISTVSRVLNETKAVDPETSRRVLSAIDALGYVPNTMKRRHETLSLLIPSSFSGESGWSNAIVGGMLDRAGSHHVMLIRHTSVEAADGASVESAKRFWQRQIRTSGIMGVVIVAPEPVEHISRGLRAAKVPYVVFGSGGDRDHFVQCDNDRVVSLSLKALFEAGHRRIAYVGQETSQVDHTTRLRAYRRFAHQHSVVPVEVLTDKTSGFQESLLEDLGRTLANPDPPTAYFVGDERMMISVVTFLREKGYQLPRDISLIGMGNSPVLSAWHPPLTLSFQRLREGMHLSVDLVLQVVEQQVREPIRVHLESDLVQGTSVGPPASSA